MAKTASVKSPVRLLFFVFLLGRSLAELTHRFGHANSTSKSACSAFRCQFLIFRMFQFSLHLGERLN